MLVHLMLTIVLGGAAGFAGVFGIAVDNGDEGCSGSHSQQ